MKRFVDGIDSSQGLLLPDRLEDYVHEDNPVRMVDAFVEALDLSELDFEAASRAAGGRPAYHPAALLKIYIYGYLNRIPSSRRLEREAHNMKRMIKIMGAQGMVGPCSLTPPNFFASLQPPSWAHRRCKPIADEFLHSLGQEQPLRSWVAAS
jgi:hypothetical protein